MCGWPLGVTIAPPHLAPALPAPLDPISAPPCGHRGGHGSANAGDVTPLVNQREAKKKRGKLTSFFNHLGGAMRHPPILRPPRGYYKWHGPANVRSVNLLNKGDKNIKSQK